MEQEKDKFCGSPALLERLRGLWDEMVQEGAVKKPTVSHLNVLEACI